MNAILDKMTINDLPDHLRPVAQAIGISAVKTLIVKLPGSVIYIPKTLNSSYNAKYIADHFNGENYQDIADHLGITVRSVYRSLQANQKNNSSHIKQESH